MDNKNKFRLRNRFNSFRYAFNGFKIFIQTQPNARIHLFAAILIIICGSVIRLNLTEWCWLVMAIALVFITEMLNTAIEFLTDILSPGIHPLAKNAKDIAACAVLIASIAAVIIACLLFIPKLLRFHIYEL